MSRQSSYSVAAANPSTDQVIAAFLIAPLIPAILSAAYTSGYDVGEFFVSLYLICLVGAYPTVILFGLPTYFFLRKVVRPRLISIAIVGALIAVLPWLILNFFDPLSDRLEFNGVVFVENGIRTVAGWNSVLRSCIKSAILGAIGGAVFYYIVAPSHRGKIDSIATKLQSDSGVKQVLPIHH
jgi:cytochrome c biogenesis protein CcdA